MMVNSQFIVFALVLVQCFIFCHGNSQLYISSQGQDDWEGNITYPLRTLQGAFNKVGEEKVWEFCLIGDGTIDGTFEFQKDISLVSLTISDCENGNSPVTLEWNQTLSNFDVSINQLTFTGTVLKTIGSFLFRPNVYKLNLSNVTIDNRISGSTFAIEIQNEFSANYTNFWGPIHISVKIQLEIVHSYIYDRLTLNTVLGVSNSLLTVSDTVFRDIKDSLHYPAVDISGFPIIRFYSTNFIYNSAGVKITCEESLTLSFEKVSLINNTAIGSTYFILLNPQGIDLTVKDSPLGCSRDSNNVPIRPFPSYLKSATITNSTVSCMTAPIIPGYQCDPSGPCTECQAGFYSDKNNCTKCEAGKVSRLPGSNYCESCEGNSVPDVTQTTCTPCRTERVDNYNCVTAPTYAPQTESSDKIYMILLIVVNVVFFCSFITVVTCAYLASKNTRERDPLLNR
eukprot:TRINITY_DN2848_c0_g1_i1.p1 TRINITY_DN2848_c0_g1~~TRINITY_DN2848_c0_g1_i1.p1  ORF type:complete len:454 (+),score=33.26 TRINITY_DN2848_c0_g1_i1:61-1422(+)